MKIKEFKKYIDEAYKKSDNGNEEVEFWLQLEDEVVLCELESIGQFHIVKDMTVTIRPNENKIYSNKELTDEELNFKKQRDELIKKIQRIESVLIEQ